MMQTAPLSTVLPYILPSAIGCPPMLAEQHARKAVATICEETGYWRHIVTSALTQPRVMVAPFGTLILKVLEATFEGNPLTAVQPEDMPLAALGDEVPVGYPSAFTQIEPGVFLFNRFQPGTLRARVTLKPRADSGLGLDPEAPLRDSYSIAPAALIASHAAAIADGALSTLLMVPAQPFTNPQLAMDHERKFITAKGMIQEEVMRGQQRAPMRTKAHWL